MKTTTQERLAFLAIAIGLLLAGYMDGQDAAMTEKSSAVAKYSIKHQGQKMACIKCGQP